MLPNDEAKQEVEAANVIVQAEIEAAKVEKNGKESAKKNVKEAAAKLELERKAKAEVEKSAEETKVDEKNVDKNVKESVTKAEDVEESVEDNAPELEEDAVDCFGHVARVSIA
jgi:hypothetical protein